VDQVLLPMTDVWRGRIQPRVNARLTRAATHCTLRCEAHDRPRSTDVTLVSLSKPNRVTGLKKAQQLLPGTRVEAYVVGRTGPQPLWAGLALLGGFIGLTSSSSSSREHSSSPVACCSS